MFDGFLIVRIKLMIVRIKLNKMRMKSKELNLKSSKQKKIVNGKRNMRKWNWSFKII